ncbi:MAG: tRNA uridine(34) 5-carboxymethylaminomethyl modification radical SAM/GNAT enzyme Elp3 [Chloroflexota bacterium]|nr:tRNA uridine(34) 5-carboxymethylaminomethyl modification radical SAM/GNAT enzyme Elp3 [Chloroflexota bacterium]
MAERKKVDATARKYKQIDTDRYRSELLAIIEAIRSAPNFDDRFYHRTLRKHPRDGSGFFSKSHLVTAYRDFVAAGDLPFEKETLYRLQMKPVRTQSGIAPVAVLTKPAGCPGHCIFCPNDPDMPKSYLSLEPGAQRALRYEFDPFRQTRGRLEAFDAVGHPIQKVELLILGGTWSAYSPQYTEWFVRRCLDALNGSDSTSLAQAQHLNERATSRCVGLTIETRPDWVTLEEIQRLRRLGVTRVQLGIQSLDDEILRLNRRGHDVETARRAVRMLRASGFKLHLHWMPNLLGATPESDLADYARLWNDPDMRPDELKVYPCSLIAGTELYEIWQQGGYQPYDEGALLALIADCKARTPRYCRLSRVVRDIPANYVAEGNRFNNLREMAQKALADSGRQCQCMRCREVRDRDADPDTLRLDVQRYETGAGLEHFLSFETQEGKLAGFLRLLLPWPDSSVETPCEIKANALIREVHVYGRALHIGDSSSGEAQHLGLGTRLIEKARQLSQEAGFRRLSVIAAIGTRDYYRQRGFELEDLYMHADL